MQTDLSKSVALEPDQPKVLHQTTTMLRTHFAALQSEVYEPMVGELKALEAGLAGAELEAVQEYRLAVEGFFAAIAREARTALAR